MAVCAEESGSHEEEPGDYLDSRGRGEPELRWLARAAELCGVLQLSPIFIAAGLCGFCAGLSRQHRVRARLAEWRLHGRGWEGREGRVDVGELLEDAAVCGQRSDRRLGAELRRILYADCDDRSAELVPRRCGCGRCGRLCDVLFRSVSRGLDSEPHRNTGAESAGLCECLADFAYRSAGAAIACAARHVGCQCALSGVSLADRRSAQKGQG